MGFWCLLRPKTFMKMITRIVQIYRRFVVCIQIRIALKNMKPMENCFPYLILNRGKTVPFRLR